jgi:hypothetical protein
MIHELVDDLSIDEYWKTSPYHYGCDGMVERFNRKLLDMLAIYMSDYHTDWDFWISRIHLLTER